MVSELDDCIRVDGSLGYYISPTAEPFDSAVAYDGLSQTVAYNPAMLNQQPPYMRAFALASAFAAHIVTLEIMEFGHTRSDRDIQLTQDYIVGYLTHCLRLRGHLPRAVDNDDPRFQYDKFMMANPRPGGAEMRQARWHSFDQGWKASGAGFPGDLTHR
jgi:hypothetical protein